jgi:hypothetical protein
VVCASTWLLCTLVFGAAVLFLPRDIDDLRETMRHRAVHEHETATV